MNVVNITTIQDIGKNIEELVWKHDISYIEAALMLAEMLGMEEENIGSLIQNNPEIMKKITIEAENLNFLGKENRLEF